MLQSLHVYARPASGAQRPHRAPSSGRARARGVGCSYVLLQGALNCLDTPPPELKPGRGGTHIRRIRQAAAGRTGLHHDPLLLLFTTELDIQGGPIGPRVGSLPLLLCRRPDPTVGTWAPEQVQTPAFSAFF